MNEHQPAAREAEEQADLTSPGDASAIFIERFAADLAEAGMQRMASRVFACLLISEDGVLSAAELARQLQVSPAAVSGAVRYLAQLHLISRERQPGSRLLCYRLHQQVWYESLASRDTLARRWLASLQTGIAAAGPDSRAGQRLADTTEFLDYLREELDGMLRRWRERQAPDAAEGPAAGS